MFGRSRRTVAPGSAEDMVARQRRFLDLRDAPAGGAPALRSAHPTGTIRELRPSQVTAQQVKDGVARDGAVIVRGLLDPAAADRLRQDVERALQALERCGKEGSSGDGWYEPFRGATESPELDWSRQIATLEHMGALLVDSPRFTSTYLALLQSLGMVDVVEGFLDAPPILSAEKSVLRRVPAQTGTNWHQDGAFLGPDVRSLNLWITLSDCGTDAPGLDLVASRPDHILPTGTQGALFDWSIGDGEVDDWRGEYPIVHPEFRAGDAVFFDHMNVHRTGVRPGMTRSRYALECWFFSPWYFPKGYTGIAART